MRAGRATLHRLATIPSAACRIESNTGGGIRGFGSGLAAHTVGGALVSTGGLNQRVQAGDPSPRQKSGNITSATEQMALAA